MTDEASLEDKRTAVALVQCQIRDDKAGWWALVRGTEDLKGVVASLSSIAATLADVLGQVTGTPAETALKRMAVSLGLETPDDE